MRKTKVIVDNLQQQDDLKELDHLVDSLEIKDLEKLDQDKTQCK